MLRHLHFTFHFLLLTSLAWAQSASDPIAQRLTFVSESTYTAYLRGLEAFGTRHAGQPNRDTVARWIAQRFLDAGVTDVVLDSFSVSGAPQWNVVATIGGTEPQAGEIVIGAHYDSQSSIPTQAPGADDNASGSSAVIEMARVLIASSYQPRRTLRFMTFGAEELGLLGSESYASRIDAGRKVGMLMLNLDMIGHRRQDTTDRDVNIVYYDHAVAEAGRAVSTAMTYTTLTPITTTQHRPNSDSWPFAIRGIPCVFYIERDFSPQYHSPHDSSTYLDLTYATEITRAGLAMVLASDAPSTASISSTVAPDRWELMQNYPNPFNGETVIRYQVEGKGDSGLGTWDSGFENRKAGSAGADTYSQIPNPISHVSLRVYDLLSREVAVLADGEKPTGVHTVTWDASKMPSGVYFYRIVVMSKGETFSATKAMVLAK